MKMRELSFDAHLLRLRARYVQRGKPGKSRLLYELCEQYRYSRNQTVTRHLAETTAKVGASWGQRPIDAWAELAIPPTSTQSELHNPLVARIEHHSFAAADAEEHW